MKKLVMTVAHILYKSGSYETFGLALSASWKRYKLTHALKNGICYFSFLKADGTNRDAIGTLREGNFNYESKGTKRAANYNVVKYFDIERKAFRSLRLDRLTAIIA